MQPKDQVLSQTRRKSLLLAYVPFLVLLVILLAQFSFTIPQGDDFLFGSLKYGSTAGGHYSIAGIFHDYWMDYQLWGGRTGNLLAEIFLWFGLGLWRVITPFVLTAMAFLIFYLVHGRLPARGDFILALLASCFVGFLPIDGVASDTLYWLDGSCNYLYPMFFCLCAAIPCFDALRGRRTHPLLRILSFLSAIFASLLHELSGIAAICMMALIVCHVRFSLKQKVHWLLWLQLAAALAGFLFLVGSPGNLARLSAIEQTNDKPGIISLLLYCIPQGFSNLFLLAGAFLSLLGLLAAFNGKTGGGSHWANILRGSLAISSVSLFALLFVFPESVKMVFASRLFSLAFSLFAVLYLLLCIAVYWKRLRENSEYSVFFLLGAFASSVISILLGLENRAFFPCILLLMCAILSYSHVLAGNRFRIVPIGLALVAAASMMMVCYCLRSNSIAYRSFLEQLNDARSGKTQQVTIAARLPFPVVAYGNAFNQRYDREIHEYYSIAENVTIVYK